MKSKIAIIENSIEFFFLFLYCEKRCILLSKFKLCTFTATLALTNGSLRKIVFFIRFFKNVHPNRHQLGNTAIFARCFDNTLCCCHLSNVTTERKEEKVVVLYFPSVSVLRKIQLFSNRFCCVKIQLHSAIDVNIFVFTQIKCL